MEIIQAVYYNVCNKFFKTLKAFHNHESFKKHKENYVEVKATFQDVPVMRVIAKPREKTYEKLLLEQLRIDEYYYSSSDDESNTPVNIKTKNMTKLRGSSNSSTKEEEEDECAVNMDFLSKRQRKKYERKSELTTVTNEAKKDALRERRQRRETERRIKNSDNMYDFSKIEDIDYHCWGHFCPSCSAEFTTKNRLSVHVKKTGHAGLLLDKVNKKDKKKVSNKCKENFYRQKN